MGSLPSCEKQIKVFSMLLPLDCVCVLFFSSGGVGGGGG